VQPKKTPSAAPAAHGRRRLSILKLKINLTALVEKVQKVSPNIRKQRHIHGLQQVSGLNATFTKHACVFQVTKNKNQSKKKIKLEQYQHFKNTNLITAFLN